MVIDAGGGWYLFAVGLAAGLAVLPLGAYLAVSPGWLRALLAACALLTISRYLAMAVFALSPDPESLSCWRPCYFATAIGLTFPGLVAMDQLIRHPAMTPQKLLRMYAPFFAAYAVILLFGRFVTVAHPLVGSRPILMGFWVAALALVQSLFVAAVLGIGATLIGKIPVPRIKVALGGLMLSYALLALDGLLILTGASAWPAYLFSESVTLVALWFAFDTARHSSF
jgi:hypothetical protein